MSRLHDILDDLRIPWRAGGSHHHIRRGWTGCDCPQCTPGSEKWRLGINEEKLYANCWTCGWSSLAAALMRLADLPYGQAAKLAAECGAAADLRDATETPTSKRGRLSLPDGLIPLLPAHQAYLCERGFDLGQLDRLWGINQGIGVAAKLMWRIFLPIVWNGRTVSWTTRSIGDARRRYIGAAPDQEILSPKQVLYGADLARHAVVVVEGPFSAIRIGPGAVATMGVDYSQAQVRLLSRYPCRAICFDSEPAAQQRARQLADELSVFPGETHIAELETGGDPAEASKREIKQLRRCFLE